jgi:hypothetical protein
MRRSTTRASTAPTSRAAGRSTKRTARISTSVSRRNEQGTLVTANAQRYDAGIAYFTKDDFDALSIRKVGASYRPYDGPGATLELIHYFGAQKST